MRKSQKSKKPKTEKIHSFKKQLIFTIYDRKYRQINHCFVVGNDFVIDHQMSVCVCVGSINQPNRSNRLKIDHQSIMNFQNHIIYSHALFSYIKIEKYSRKTYKKV